MKLTLNALFDYTNDDGIFTYLNNYDVPWKNDVDADLLDLDYHSKYGTRIVSKTVTSLLTTEGLPTANKNKLAKLAYSKNKAKWDELWRTLGIYNDFNILDNTDWEESVTIEHEGEDAKTQNLGQKVTQFSKGAQTNAQTKGEEIDTSAHGAQSRTTVKGQQTNSEQLDQHTLTDGSHTDTIGSQNVTMEEKTAAFNNTAYSPNTKKEETLGSRQDQFGQVTHTDSGASNSYQEGQRSDTDSTEAYTDTLTSGQRLDSQTEGARSDSQTEGAQENTESGTNSFSETTTTSRHGNIGVTTAGQLIRDFRKTVNWNFFETVFEDLNDLLVIDVYGKEDDNIDDYTFITNYVLPIASPSVLGGIKVGQNLNIGSDGTLNAQIPGGAVASVNGKTGIVILNAADVGAATPSDIKVLSVNNKTGDVILNASDVGAATSQDVQNAIQTAISGIQFPVIKVNNKTGEVILTASDVGAATASDIQNAIAGVNQVPTGGTLNQVLTKTADGYGWANSQGGQNWTSVPYTLVAGYLQNNNGLANWWVDDPGDETRSYVFDVSEHVGKEFALNFYTVGNYPFDRCRAAFMPYFDLATEQEPLAGSKYLGSKGEGTLWLQQCDRVYPGGVTSLNTTNKRSWINEMWNYREGIIPPNMKYLIVYIAAIGTAGGVVSNYDNEYVCTLKVKN